MPRGGNAGGGGQPGWILKCKGWETDPNAYIYFTVQGHAWEPICDAIGKPEWKTDPAYTTAKARQPHIMNIFATIEDFIKDKTKFEAVDILRKFDIPCAPVLSMKELLHDKSLRDSGSIVEVPAQGARQLLDHRQPDQVLGPEARGHGLAAARRTHRRGAGRTGLQRRQDRRDARRQGGLRPCGPCTAAGREATAPARAPSLFGTLRRQELQMKTEIDLPALVAAMGDAVMVCDADGAITLWNPAAERLFGYAEAEALGQSLDLIIPERLRKRHWEGYEKTMATGITRYGHDVLRVPAVNKAGGTLSIAFTVALLHGAGRQGRRDRVGHARRDRPLRRRARAEEAHDRAGRRKRGCQAGRAQ